MLLRGDERCGLRSSREGGRTRIAAKREVLRTVDWLAAWAGDASERDSNKSRKVCLKWHKMSFPLPPFPPYSSFHPLEYSNEIVWKGKSDARERSVIVRGINWLITDIMMMRLVAKSANESMNMQTRPTHLSHPFNPDSLFLQLSKAESKKHASIELTSLPLSLCGPLEPSIHPPFVHPSRPLWFRIHWQVKRLFLPASPSVLASLPLSVFLSVFSSLILVPRRSQTDQIKARLSVRRHRERASERDSGLGEGIKEERLKMLSVRSKRGCFSHGYVFFGCKCNGIHFQWSKPRHSHG